MYWNFHKLFTLRYLHGLLLENQYRLFNAIFYLTKIQSNFFKMVTTRLLVELHPPERHLLPILQPIIDVLPPSFFCCWLLFACEKNQEVCIVCKKHAVKVQRVMLRLLFISIQRKTPCT